MRSDNTHGCVFVAAIGIMFLMCGGCGVGWLTGGIPYSDGHREGYIQKFSHKGIVWVTHEGELALPGLRTVGSGDDAHITNTWEFSVTDQDIAKQLHDLHQNDLVRLHYKQYLCSPPWKGSTGYFITKVEHVNRNSK